MGLAERKKRKTLSYDPNNTAWTRSDGFGRKILTSQGWSPGKYLGSKDATHAFSKASASGVSIKLKDNNFGVGVKTQVPPSASYNSLLSAYDNILGRLNGKTDAELGIEKEEKAAIGRRTYTMQRYGTTHFVRGGYLIGDRIEKTKPQVSTPGGGNAENPVIGHAPSDPGAQAESLRSKPIQTVPQHQEEAAKAQRRARKEAEKHACEKEDASRDHAGSLGEDGEGYVEKPHKESKSDRRRRKEDKQKRREERRRRKEAKELKRSKRERQSGNDG